MNKSVVWWGLICLLLATATGLTVWWLIWGSSDETPAVEGTTNFGIGLPEEELKEKKGQEMSSEAALVWDTEAQIIRFEKNGFARHSIASITKLMTAIVALDFGLEWEKEMEIESREYVIGGRLLLHPGERVTVRDLFNVSLLGSANNATLAYVRSLEVPEKEFIQAMNRKAIELGLEQTEFVDVTGLDPDNISTAYEVARLTETAFNNYQDIASATNKKEYVFEVRGSGREKIIKNTNKLVTDEGMEFKGGKTGYLYEASFCLVVQGSGKLANRIAVILGSPSEWVNMQDTKSVLFGN
jgi:D-alanyl-D-alanine carboxypeptidase